LQETRLQKEADEREREAKKTAASKEVCGGGGPFNLWRFAAIMVFWWCLAIMRFGFYEVFVCFFLFLSSVYLFGGLWPP